MASDLTAIVGDIEDAVQERLQAKLSGIRRFDYNDNPDTVRCPAVNIGLYDVRFKPISRRCYRADAEFALTLMVANPRDEHLRRREVYPLLMSTAGLLGHWRPTRVIDSVTVDLGAAELRLDRARKTLESGSRIAYTTMLRTHLGFEIPDESEWQEITSIVLRHVLKPGDDEPEVEDTVNVGG